MGSDLDVRMEQGRDGRRHCGHIRGHGPDPGKRQPLRSTRRVWTVCLDWIECQQEATVPSDEDGTGRGRWHDERGNHVRAAISPR